VKVRIFPRSNPGVWFYMSRHRMACLFIRPKGTQAKDSPYVRLWSVLGRITLALCDVSQFRPTLFSTSAIRYDTSR
jgi:hypothetical protein